MCPMSQTPSSNYNDNSAPGAAVHTADPQSHSVELMSIRSLPFSSSPESMKDGYLLRKGRKRKATTQDVQISPNGQHEIENTHLTAQPSPDYACHACHCQYAKDRVTGKITCMVCGEEGHYTCDCSMKHKEQQVICTICNKVGHCHLWCCRQNVSENRACRRCGEKGHYTKKKHSYGQKCSHNKDVSCSSCDTHHPLGKCPMGNITCFICEGTDHVPAQCRLSPMLIAVTQYLRESICATLKKAMTETDHDEEVPKVSNFSSSGHGHSELSDVTCLICYDKGHKSFSCPKKKPPGESELFDVTCLICYDKGHKSFSCPKKKPRGELELSNVTCFICNDKGHKSFSCPKKKPPGELERSDVTCLKCHAKDHYTYSCPQEKPPELSDVRCFTCHDKGHKSFSCPKKKTPGELELSDVTCLKCYDKGHKSFSCHKKKQTTWRRAI